MPANINGNVNDGRVSSGEQFIINGNVENHSWMFEIWHYGKYSYKYVHKHTATDETSPLMLKMVALNCTFDKVNICKRNSGTVFSLEVAMHFISEMV